MLKKAKEVEEVEVCSKCGQPLVELPWSKSELGQRMYILTCDNAYCAGYRNPVKTITREKATG